MARLSTDKIWEFADALKQTFSTPSDTRAATVQSVDSDGTVWVVYPGASSPTPIASVGAAVDNNEDKLVVAGGVAANGRLREKLSEACGREGIRLCVPPAVLCTDNAAMIGAAGYYKYISEGPDELSLDAVAHLPLG